MPRSAKFRVPDSYVHGVNLVNGNVTWEFKKNKLYSYHITILILKQRKARPPEARGGGDARRAESRDRAVVWPR